MFNVGPGELIVIALVLLIAVGPEQLPGVIRKAGKTAAQVRSMTDGLRSEFMAGLDEIERAADIKAWAESDANEPAEFAEATPPDLGLDPAAVGESPHVESPDGETADGEDVDGEDVDGEVVGEAEVIEASAGASPNGATNGSGPASDPAEEPPSTEQEPA